MKSAIVFGAILLGFVLLIASSLWSTLFPATSAWTSEKSTRLAEVKDRLTNLSFIINRPASSNQMHSGPDPAALKSEYDQLVKENEQLNADFQTAYDRPNTISRILKWTGILLAGLGILGWFAVRET